MQDEASSVSENSSTVANCDTRALRSDGRRVTDTHSLPDTSSGTRASANLRTEPRTYSRILKACRHEMRASATHSRM